MANGFKMTVGQIRDKRRAVRHNIGGIRGLAVRIDGATETMQALAQLPAAVQRKVLRQALAAAARPVLRAMKTGARQYASEAKETLGTTERSLIVKVATSKKDPSIAYALVGARRGYAEIATINREGRLQSLRVRRRGKKLRQGVYAVKGVALKRLGAKARRARLDPDKGLIQRRKPTRYLHLIELGGKKRRVRAGHFMDNAALSASGESRNQFNKNFSDGLVREFAKRAAK